MAQKQKSWIVTIVGVLGFLMSIVVTVRTAEMDLVMRVTRLETQVENLSYSVRKIITDINVFHPRVWGYYETEPGIPNHPRFFDRGARADSSTVNAPSSTVDDKSSSAFHR